MESNPEGVFMGYVTKYALTGGIEKCQLAPTESDRMVKQVGPNYATYYHGEGKDWHRTREAAVARAEQMRHDKIASLRKSIAKLEAMTF